MPVNINSTLFMLQALEQTFGAASFFKDTFFPNPVTSPTEEVLIDYRKGDRRLAPFVNEGASGKNVTRNGFTTLKYKPPIMIPKIPLTAQDLQQRAFGEQIFSKLTAQERAMTIRAKDLNDLRMLNDRRTEWMCAKLLVTGSVPIKGYTDDGETFIEDTMTFDWNQKETLTGTATWDKSTADIYGDIQDMFDTISTNSSNNPDVMVMATDVEKMLLSNEKFLKLLDTRYLNVVNFVPKIQKPGVRYIGTINEFALEVYVYTAQYKDDDGKMKKYLPDSTVIMGISGRGSLLYGAITQVNPDTKVFETFEGRDVPKIWVPDGKDVQMLRLGRRVVPKPEFTDDWYTLVVK